MANNAWSVTTEKLRTAAEAIREKTTQYKTEYTKLYTELQSMRSAQWQGIASDAFNAKLESYRSNFEKLETVLQTYTDGLDTRAKNYEDTENAVKEAADSL